MNTRSIKLIYTFILSILVTSCNKNNSFLQDNIEKVKVEDTLVIPMYKEIQSDFNLKDKLDLRGTKFDTKDLFSYKKIQLHKDFHSLVVYIENSPIIMNFDQNWSFIASYDISKCWGSGNILNGEVVCAQGYGYPYNTYQKIIVNDKGIFHEIKNYKPNSSKKREPERLNYILDKIPFIKKENPILIIPYDEDFYRENFPNFINVSKEEFVSIFLNKNIKNNVFLKLIDKLENITFTFNFKIKTKEGILLPIIIYADNLEEFEVILLSYNNKNRLKDIYLNDFTLNQLLSFQLDATGFMVKIIGVSKKELDTNVAFGKTFFVDSSGSIKEVD